MVNTSLVVALPVVSVFWLVIGAGVPWCIPKGPNRGVIRTMIVMTAVCCYVFWLLAFLAQLNPLIGPTIPNSVAGHMRRAWGNINSTTQYPCYPSW